MFAHKTAAFLFSLLQPLGSRPLLLLGLALLLPGLCPTRFACFLIAAVCLLLLLGLMLLPYADRRFRLLLGASLILLSASALRVAALLPPPDIHAGRLCESEGKLGRLLSRSADGSRLLWEYTSREGLRLALRSGPELLDVSCLKAELLLKKAERKSNPGGFDQRSWLAGKGIAFCAEMIGKPVILLKRLFPGEKFRQVILGSVERYAEQLLGKKEAALYLALAFSRRSALAPELRAALQWLGLSHLFSVSGMHWTFLLNFLRRAGKACGRRGSFLLSLPVAGTYLFLSGRPAGLERAFNLYVCREAAASFRCRCSALSLLGAAALLAGLKQPFALLDRGFLSSYAAAASIFYFSPLLERRVSKYIPCLGRRVHRSLAALMAAQAAVLLISLEERRLLHFAYLLLQPAMIAGGAFLFLLTPCCLFFSCILGASWPALPASFLLRFYARICCALSQLPASLTWPYRVGFPALLALLLFFLGISSFYLTNLSGAPAKFKMRMSVLLLLALLIQIFLPAAFPSPPEFYFFDVGQGDGMLLCWGKQAMLFDGGEAEKAFSVWIPAFLALGIDRVEAALLTHEHTDHSGAQRVLAKLGRIKYLYRGTSCASVEAADTGTAGQKRCRQMGQPELPLQVLKAGDRLEISRNADISLEVLAASRFAGDPRDENSHCLMLLLRMGKARILLSGDPTPEKEAIFLREDARQADILKVGHHGSRAVSGEAFLDMLQPRLAFVPTGVNAYGHPHEETLERIRQRGIILTRGDRDGALCIRIEKTGMFLMTWKRRKRFVLPYRRFA